MRTSRIAGLVLVTAGAMMLLRAATQPGKQFLNLGSSKPPGFTHVVTSPPGKMILISGQGGAAADGTMPADFPTQAKNTFENLRKCLALAGADFGDVVKINYFVTDLENTAELRRVRAGYLNMTNPPAATLVRAGLGAGLLLEVEAIAIVP